MSPGRRLQLHHLSLKNHQQVLFQHPENCSLPQLGSSNLLELGLCPKKLLELGRCPEKLLELQQCLEKLLKLQQCPERCASRQLLLRNSAMSQQLLEEVAACQLHPKNHSKPSQRLENPSVTRSRQRNNAPEVQHRRPENSAPPLVCLGICRALALHPMNNAGAPSPGSTSSARRHPLPGVCVVRSTAIPLLQTISQTSPRRRFSLPSASRDHVSLERRGRVAPSVVVPFLGDALWLSASPTRLVSAMTGTAGRPVPRYSPRGAAACLFSFPCVARRQELRQKPFVPCHECYCRRFVRQSRDAVAARSVTLQKTFVFYELMHAFQRQRRA